MTDSFLYKTSILHLCVLLRILLLLCKSLIVYPHGLTTNFVPQMLFYLAESMEL